MMKPPSPLPRPPRERLSHRLRWPLAFALALGLSMGSLALLLVRDAREVAPSENRILAALRSAPLPPSSPSAPPPGRGTTPAGVEASHASSRSVAPHAPVMRSADSDAPPAPPPGTAANPDTPAMTQSASGAPGPGAVSSSASPQAGGIGMAGGGTASEIECQRQVEPRFPKAALDDGLSGGEVLARFHLDEHGQVHAVDIVQERPAGYFAAAVRAAARGWQCSGGRGDSVLVRFPFVVRTR